MADAAPRYAAEMADADGGRGAARVRRRGWSAQPDDLDVRDARTRGVGARLSRASRTGPARRPRQGASNSKAPRAETASDEGQQKTRRRYVICVYIR